MKLLFVSPNNLAKVVPDTNACGIQCVSECENESSPTGGTSRERTRKRNTTTRYQKKNQNDTPPPLLGGFQNGGGGSTVALVAMVQGVL